MEVFREGTTILTVSEKGYGRKSENDDYRRQSRGGKGVTNYRVEQYGDVSAVAAIEEDDDVILISSDGIIIRIAADQISTFSRPSKGVRVMKVTEGEVLATMTAVPREEEEENPTEEEPVENEEEVTETSEE